MKFAKRVLQHGGSDLFPRPLPKKKNSKQLNMARVILKLASINGYNDREEIKLEDGSYLDNTNVIDLLNYAMTPTRARKGIEHFVNLLHEAGVEPLLILNGQLKHMLAQRTMRPPSVIPIVQPLTPVEKRKHRSDDDYNGKRVKRSDIPDEALTPNSKIDWEHDSDIDD